MAVGVEESQAQVSVRSSGLIPAKLLAGIDLRPLRKRLHDLAGDHALFADEYFGKLVPNMGALLFDCSLVASS